MAPLNRETISIRAHNKFCPQIHSKETNRNEKYKTVLCTYWLEDNWCNYGDKCFYAHGKHELRSRKEVDSYRMYPCLNWVSTGSCPLDGKCICNHDLRAKGNVSHWLPHMKTPKTIQRFNAQADDIYHLQLSSISKNSPFGSLLKSDETHDWNHFYNAVCNLPIARENRISHENKLEIALRMCYHEKKTDYYTFKPNYLVLGKPAMILQRRAFLIDKEGVQDITLKRYHFLSLQGSKLVTIVNEIAFGPISDNSECRLGIYFDIPMQSMLPYTKGMKKIKNANDETNGFLPETPFYITETLDEDAYQLIRDVIRFYVVHDNSSNDANKTKTSQDLKQRFENIMLNYSKWSWPSNTNEHVTEVNTCYDFNDNCAQNYLNAQKLWRSFINAMDNEISKVYDDVSHARLKAFASLEHQKYSTSCTLKIADNYKTNASSQGEKCWKSLLMNSSVNNEWEELLQYYTRINYKS